MKHRGAAPFILAIDQGTTSTRSMVVDAAGVVQGIAYRAHRQIVPQPGWLEHDPEEIWSSVEATASEAVSNAGITAADLAGVGLANQGETLMAWDAQTLRPMANAIVWQCNRTGRTVERMKRNRGLQQAVHRTTGLVLDSYFSATKMKWLYDRVTECRALSRQGRLRMGTLDTWLLAKASGGSIFATDATTASRTLLMDLHTADWSPKMLDTFGIRREWLPTIVSTIGMFGTAELAGGRVPLLASAVDQQCALFGQCCFEAGAAKCTFGTGAFLLMHTGTKPVLSRKGILTTVAFGATKRPLTYALDGGIYTAGSAVNWLRDTVGFTSDEELHAIAGSVPDAGGLTFIPCLAGLAAPYWDRSARGLLYGIDNGTTRGHIVRALLEGIAMRVYTVTETMKRESGTSFQPPLRVDGGLAQSRPFLQFLSDILHLPVEVPQSHESTALGVAYMAGLQAGVWRSTHELELLRKPAMRLEPAMPESRRAEHIRAHRRAIQHILRWDA